MRILLITATYPPSANGVAISVKSLKDKLVSKGHNVLVLAPKNKKTKRERGVVFYPSADNPMQKDYPIPLFPMTYGIAKRVTKFKPELIHVHHPFHIGFVAQLLSKTLNIPIVFTYHTKYDYHANNYLSFIPNELKGKFVWSTVKDFCNKMNLVIAPSENIKKSLLKNGIKTRVSVIPSVPDDLNIPRQKREMILKNLKLPQNKTILLTVGRLSPEKHMDKLIKSMKILSKKYILIICGSGPEKKNLKKLAKLIGVDDRVLFVGRVGRSDISKYYQVSDYLYFASDSETQGLIYWEALNFGLPVVTVNTDISKEWVKEDFGVLVKKNPQDLAKGVLIIEKKNYLKMSKLARDFSKKFSANKFADSVIEEYERLVY